MLCVVICKCTGLFYFLLCSIPEISGKWKQFVVRILMYSRGNQVVDERNDGVYQSVSEVWIRAFGFTVHLNDLIRLGDMTHTSYHNTLGHCYDTQGVSQYSLANKLSAKEKLFFSYFSLMSEKTIKKKPLKLCKINSPLINGPFGTI